MKSHATSKLPRIAAQISCLSVALGTLCAGQAIEPSVSNLPSQGLPKLGVEQIVSRLETANRHRAELLSGYESKRDYSIVYQGFPKSYEAAMQVGATYTAPSSKDFTILNESGSKVMQGRVLHKLLESEKQATDPENQRHTALTAENYDFELSGERPTQNGGCYLLAVTPKRDNKFLYRGEICVNAVDFAVETIDAEPAKNPSFWIKKTEIHHKYGKFGDFWLPVANDTTSSTRFGGKAKLTIRYEGYRLQQRGERAGHAGPSELEQVSTRVTVTESLLLR